MSYPNSGSTLQPERISTLTGLSTAIIIKVDRYAVGAIQEFTINQSRNLKRITEAGTDGVIEIIPSGVATIELSVTRVYFDGLSISEAFARAFSNIQAQRVPFNIDVYNFQYAFDGKLNKNSDPIWQSVDRGPLVKRIHNCWFSKLSTPIKADNFIITESASIMAEYITTFTPAFDKSKRGLWPQGANIDTIEKEIDVTGRRGSLSETSLEPRTWRMTLDDLSKMGEGIKDLF